MSKTAQYRLGSCLSLESMGSKICNDWSVWTCGLFRLPHQRSGKIIEENRLQLHVT